MARTTVKGTYSLDPETVRALDRMSRRWGVSKSEALRRAILASAKSADSEVDARLAALDRAQQAVGLDASKADAWIREVRAERKANV